MIITDLPHDVLSLIFAYLDPNSFLRLCASAKALYINYHHDPEFWRTQTATTFRTPISPLLKTDGARWYSLYKRLRTQTRLFTWGQGLKGNLGQGIRHPPFRQPRGPRGRALRVPTPMVSRPVREVFQRLHSQWPTEAHVPDDVGAIADLQCGGWSTTILSSAGKLYTAGCINASNFVYAGSQSDRFEQLHYLTENLSAISQFSSGREHILALNEDGEIISWDRINCKGIKINSRHGGRFSGRPTRVVAGWGESSAYIPDIGIIYWKPIATDTESEELDAKEVREKVIPNTARYRTVEGNTVEVIAHVVLEGKIAWITSDSKVFSCAIGHQNQEDTEPTESAVQLPGYANDEDPIRDIQGSFRHFVVFTESGRVLAGDIDYVNVCSSNAADIKRESYDDTLDASDPITWSNREQIEARRPTDVLALQRTGVISIRFGDWHYHALHSNGQITSHGHEPESCGALGLGQAINGGRLRGLVRGPGGMRQDTFLRPVANLTGRQIWFEPEKRDWLEHLQKIAEETARNNREEPYWNNILTDPAKQTMFSEWIEQEGRHWEDGPQTGDKKVSDDIERLNLADEDKLHLSSYFVLAIGAAGWHSGALVLVDEEKAEAIKHEWMSKPIQAQHHDASDIGETSKMPGHFDESGDRDGEQPTPVWTTDTFPRIKFPDDTESPLAPGEEQSVHNALRSWRHTMPSMQDLGLTTEQG